MGCRVVEQAAKENVAHLPLSALVQSLLPSSVTSFPDLEVARYAVLS